MEQADSEFMTSDDQRIYLRDGIATVSFDGKSHELLTMIAAFSGIFAAVCILSILVVLINRKQKQIKYDKKLHRQSIFTIFRSSQTFDTLSKKHQTCVFIDIPDTFSKCRHNHVYDAKFRSAIILPEIATVSC